ncbi:MAG: MBL fold metallo-hydrolase [Candidatus Thorarchaeota archaeon]|nr:MBL fold metallo-hydrolase [Candidatus Thorarchaeota archaeon]
MKQSSIGSRGHLFSFTDPYFHNTYLIIGSDQIVICDTSCGPEPMEHVKRFVEAHRNNDQQIIVFNSHHHYDHVWGNSVFSTDSIYAHKSCYEALEKNGERDLVQFSSHKCGDIELVLPNQIFTDVVFLDNGAIELFHSPGHTYDSSSCFDHVDKVLFVGDNVESPIPYISDGDLDQYIATLVEYRSMDWDYLVTGHDPVQSDRALLEANIEYLERLRKWVLRLNDLPPEAQDRHITNMVELGKLVNPAELGPDARPCFAEVRNILESRVHSDEKVRSMLKIVEHVLSSI